MASTMSPAEFTLENLRLCRGHGAIRGWDRDTKKLWPTLSRSNEDEAWGFSVTVGGDIGDNTAGWSGIAARRHDKGIWIKVNSVRNESPASRAGIQTRDMITRINGQASLT